MSLFKSVCAIGVASKSGFLINIESGSATKDSMRPAKLMAMPCLPISMSGATEGWSDGTGNRQRSYPARRMAQWWRFVTCNYLT
jgi:hypothetical protein